jgi:hypothetical protein
MNIMMIIKVMMPLLLQDAYSVTCHGALAHWEMLERYYWHHHGSVQLIVRITLPPSLTEVTPGPDMDARELLISPTVVDD